MNKLADGVFSDEQIINLLTTKPADILGLSQKIDINKPANLTLFTLSGEGTFEKDQIECVSKERLMAEGWIFETSSCALNLFSSI